jgi:hypothetical protein
MGMVRTGGLGGAQGDSALVVRVQVRCARVIGLAVSVMVVVAVIGGVPVMVVELIMVEMIGVEIISRQTIHLLAVLEDAKLGRSDTAAQDAVGRDVATGKGKASQGRGQLGQRKSGIKQGAKHHVAGDPGKTVEVQQSRH